MKRERYPFPSSLFNLPNFAKRLLHPVPPIETTKTSYSFNLERRFLFSCCCCCAWVSWITHKRKSTNKNRNKSIYYCKYYALRKLKIVSCLLVTYLFYGPHDTLLYEIFISSFIQDQQIIIEV